MRKYTWMLCLFVLALLAAGCALSQTESGVLIGTNLALSGKGMSYSVSTERGVELAKDQLNEQGGLFGRPVQLVSVDNHGKPEDAVAAIQQLSVRHVSAIIGPDVADCARAVIPSVEAVRIPLISPAGTQPDVTVDTKTHEVYRYMFRATFIDASQGRAMADYALKQLQAKRAAVFYYPDQGYAQGLAEYFHSAFSAGGGSVPVFKAVRDPKALAGEIELVRRNGIQVIYLPGYDDWTIPAISAFRLAGVEIPLLGPDGWNGLKMIQDLPEAYLSQLYFTDHYAGAESNPQANAFAKAYYGKYGVWPDSYAALGYDAMMLVAQAIERCQSADAPAVAAELVKTIDYQGATGKLSLDANHDAIRDVYVLTFKNGAPALAATIHP